MLISASIVTFKTPFESLSDLIENLSRSKLDRVYVIENSPENLLEKFLTHPKFFYKHNPSNPGFGASHNIGLKDVVLANFDYHFVINPDIHLLPEVIEKMVQIMEKDSGIGMMMPRIEFPDGSIQYLPKLLPTPLSLLGRKLKRPKFLHDALVNKYELRFVDENLSYSCPVLSGCFTLFRLNSVKEIGYYDERYFMYWEDWDLSRRMNNKYKTIYSPEVKVIHEYNSGANKNIKLFFYFIKSMITYFHKWGWFCDRKRKYLNLYTLLQFKK
jgi:GT2 family glycosyltransferase